MCWGWSFVPHAPPFLCRIGIRISGDMAGLRSKAPTGDERQYGKDHHEHEHRTRRRSSCDKAAQCGADDNAHVGEHGDGGVDVFELDRIVSEVGWIGCGDGLGESHHKARSTAPSRTMPVALPKTRIAAPVANVPTMLSKK